MTRNETSGIEVILDVSASNEEVQGVQDAFAKAGVEVDVQAAYERKGIGEFPWIVLLSVPATAFFSAMAAAAGKDAYRALKGIIGAVWAVRKRCSGPRGDVILRDEDTGTWIMLEPDLPEEAYEKLAGLDPTRFRAGSLRYDWELGEWRSPTGE